MEHWGTGSRAPLDFKLFNFGGSLQSRTNSAIRLRVVSYPVKQYTGLQLCHCLLHKFSKKYFVHHP